jgi:hypothetical protein
MMDPSQRIEYEIRDCAVTEATHSDGYATTLKDFMERLQPLLAPALAGRVETARRAGSAIR